MTPAPRSMFVNVIAWLSLAMAAVGVLGGGLQWLMMATITPPDLWLQAFESAGTPLPPSFAWMFEHFLGITFASIVASLVMGVVSWGLLQRKEWGRIGFIALLVLGALLPFAGAVLTDHVMTWMNTQFGPAIAEVDPTVMHMQRAMVWLNYGFAVVIAVLHLGIVWKLCTAAIRAEFKA